MSTERIRAVYKAPGKLPVTIEVENELEALQRAVGGYLEPIRIATNAYILCDEEGTVKGLPYNATIFNVNFIGPILFVGTENGEFCDVPEDIEKAMPALFDLEMKLLGKEE